MESTAKTAGDFANTSDGLANGMRILEAQIMDTQAEIGNQLLPVIAEVIPVIREMATELGEKLVEAVKQIDFKALITSVTDFTGFLITNLETITKVIVGLFALNTAYKLMVVFAGLATVATDLYKWSVAQATAGIGLKTIAVNLLTSALKLLPFVAVVGGIASIITELVKATDTFNTFRGQLDKGSVSMKDFDKDLGAVAATFLTFDIKGNPFLQLLQDGITLALQLTGALNKIPGNVTTTYTLIRQTAGQVASSFGGNAFDAANAAFQASRMATAPETISGGGSSAKASNPLQDLFADPAKNLREDKQAVKLEGAGLAKEVARWAVSVAKPVAVARKILGRIDRNGATAIANVTRQYQNSSAGRAAAASAAAQAESDGYAAAEAIRQAEKAALEERERVYKSFADSVKSTFAGIKNSILGAFDLTQLGGSTNAITRNMDKLLVRLRAFASNVSKLSGMGLNPALLQQVITAGPLAGARLAESLVMGGAGALSAINAGFSEFGALSSQIAQTGTESLFNREAQQTVFNINVDGGVGSGATIGKAIVDAIKSYERTSGAVWQGA
jgi:hypothetical protein